MLLNPNGQAQLGKNQIEKVIAQQTAQAIFIDAASRHLPDGGVTDWTRMARESFEAAEAYAAVAVERGAA